MGDAPSRTIILALLVALTGCGPAATDKPPAPQTDPHQLDAAQEELVATCMRGHGFAYTVVPADPALTDDRDFPYGIDDVDWARRHGLGLAQRATAARRAGTANPNNRYAAALSPDQQRAYSTALFGTDAANVDVTIPTGQVVTTHTDGCLASAQNQLYGDLRRWFPAMTITNNLAPAIQPKVYADKRYQQRLASWSACMAGQGFPSGSPAELRAELSVERERAAGLAEATCVRRTGLAALGNRLDGELGAPVRARYQAEIRDYQQLRAAALDRLR